MDANGWGSKLRDALLTVPAVWLCFILAGFSVVRLQPGTIGTILSVAICVVLLFAWGYWTGPGRRTALPVFLLASLLYPIFCTAVLLTLPLDLTMGPLQWLGVGMLVGYQPGGGADTPIEFYIIPMLVNMLIPIAFMGVLREQVRATRRD